MADPKLPDTTKNPAADPKVAPKAPDPGPARTEPAPADTRLIGTGHTQAPAPTGPPQVIHMVQAAPKPAEPTPHANQTPPGGVFFVDGQWVDAHRKPLKEHKGKKGDADVVQRPFDPDAPENRDLPGPAVTSEDEGDTFNKPQAPAPKA